ncbi:uncharacterized protein N7500_000649 [Penicillium coprophilum]|uniref:uncharacterized protein n=1 Tax=Penicillium coprophilum TaxID=36646 RepID=UPI0023A6E8A3|nr:uncharacterized protein N7500_000649 [Penicillium coprophilum]KAJ5177950.1 hypothetical protein N7500_000649 [Penicillium coprophilum]
MKYNLPTLLALCQDTGAHCKWTSQAKHCKIVRPGRNKKPVLSENPRNRPTRESARSSRPNKNPASKPFKNRPNRASGKPPEPVFFTNDAGFAQFLKKHTSPKHQRVTAGGRIVPMEPSRPPHLDSPSNAPMDVTNDDESIVTHVFVDDQLVAGGHDMATQENLTIIRSSTESDNALHGILPSPLLTSTSQLAAPAYSQDLTVSPAIGTSSHVEWAVQGVPDEDDLEFIRQTGWQERVAWIESLINIDDAAIAQMLAYTPSYDISHGCDYYIRYVRKAWMVGLETMAEAFARLNSKFRCHERYLQEVSEAIALDPQISPSDYRYNLRVFHTNERARVLRAIEEHDMLMAYGEAIDMDNTNEPRGAVVDPGHQNSTEIQEQLETSIAGNSHVNLSTDGANEIQHLNTNRGVDIIDPDTGHPIQFQRQSLTAANNSCSNETGCKKGNNPKFDHMQVDGSSDLLIRDEENGNTSRRISLFNEIQVDRRSDLWVRDGSGDVPTGSNDPPFDADSRLGIRLSPEMDSEGETDEIISAIPREAWTERRLTNGSRMSETVPRNFGRNNVFNYRPPLRSVTEVNHEEHVTELASTAANNGSPTPSLMFSPRSDADEVSHPTEDGAPQNGLRFLQNEPCDESASAGSDDEQPMIRDFRSGPVLTEEMLSSLSIDQQRRSADVLENFFDVLVVDVQGDWGAEESGERSGRAFAEQMEDSLNHSSRNGSITLTINGFRGDYPDDMSDTPLLSRNSPFGRYSPFDSSGPLSRNSPSRAISRSSVRRRSDVPAGGLSSVGSRMISSSLNARRRHDARENVRNARRSLTISSRLIEDLRDEVPVTTLLGFDAPDSQQNTNYLPVYPRLIDASLRHTAPPIVNTSKINAYAHR